MARQLKQVPVRNAPISFWIDLVTRPETNASGHVSFEHALEPDNRFRGKEKEFSRTNAWWLAEASLLAYWRDAALAKKIYSDHAALDCIVLSGGSTLCHLAFNEEFAIVAFRGTQSDEWRDLFDDGQFGMTDWTNGHVHSGFKKAFQRIRKVLEDALNTHARGLPVWMTGHSLGAALAVLAADSIDNTQGLYTFGLPRVGDQIFAGHFNQRFQGRSFRYVDDHDVVTHVPPEPFGFPVGSYSHLEERRWIDKEGHVTTAAPGLSHFVQEVFGKPVVLYHTLQLLIKGQQPVMLDALADHAPVLYATHTWNDLVRNP